MPNLVNIFSLFQCMPKFGKGYLFVIYNFAFFSMTWIICYLFIGDLWSYDYFQQEFVVSPEPDLGVMTLDLKKDVCIILATDGLWNMMSGQDAVSLVQDVENENRNLIAKFGVSENTVSVNLTQFCSLYSCFS